MPESSENAFAPVSDRSSAPSVFDFLYNDSRRIGAYLSQFEGGHLTQLTRSAEQTQSTSEQSGRQFNLGVNRALGGASNSSESEGVSAKEALTRTFDPYWTNARAFLDFLSDRSLIERDLYHASMGQFVLVSGALVIIDMKSMEAVWKMSTFNEMLAANVEMDEAPPGNRSARRAQGKSNATPKDPLAGFPVEMRMALDILPTVPHSVIAAIVGDHWATWSTLSSEHLVGTANDLVLKHGTKVAGTWNMLGVLDAMPDGADSGLSIVEQVLLSNETGLVSNAAMGLAPAIRMIAGRPPNSFGLTPLLIFREIAAGLRP